MHSLDQTAPKVAVFMPVYNHAAFLADAIESVLQQDYANTQLFIGDDASKDRSPDIIKDYAARYPDKITYYINEKNMGVTDNCNKLLGLCDGDYVAFTAGDDIFLPHKISYQIEFMQRHPGCVVSYTNARIFGANVKDSLYYGPFPGRRAYETKHGDISLFMRHRNFIAGCTIMARKDSFPAGLYNREIPTMSDWLFFVEAASKGDVLYIDKVFSGYRRHENSLTTRYPPVAEFEKTYQLMQEKFPTSEKAIAAGLARLYSSFIGYYLLKKDFSNTGLMMAKLGKILQKNPALIFFVVKYFLSDCVRYTYRLLNQGFNL